jgi:CheY-like chemotaxis protein
MRLCNDINKPRPDMKENRVRGKRILIVDDEPLVREALRQLLGLDDHIIIDAANGREALDLFSKGPAFDLVITDYTMPEINGGELIARIRRVMPNQPILMITAFSSELGAKPSADLVLKKPFTLDDLRGAIAQLLG